MTLNDLSNSIKERRKILNITQKQLAEIAEIGLRTLINIESGNGNPTVLVINKLAIILGMELKFEVKKHGF